jgi:DNA gyrase subunit A
MEVVNEGATILTVSGNGMGKRTSTEEYRVQGRGGVGIITMKVTDKTGKVISVKQVTESDEIMLITNTGKIIRMKANAISVIGRNTQGVRLINLEEGEQVSAVAKVAESEEEEKDDQPPAAGGKNDQEPGPAD